MRLTGIAGEDWIFKHESGETPQPGFLYELENVQTGTAAQNKAFHALLSAFYLWMVRSDQFDYEYNGSVIHFPSRSEEDFREWFKYHYGAGATHYQYVDDDMSLVKVKSLDEIPEHILSDNPGDERNGVLIMLREGLRNYVTEAGAAEQRGLLNKCVYLRMKDYLIKSNPQGKNRRVKAVLKSWGKYTKKERKNAIDRLQDIVKAVSCFDKKVIEIMEGMES